MNTQHLPSRLRRTHSPMRLAGGLLMLGALFTAACDGSSSNLTSPTSSPSFSRGPNGLSFSENTSSAATSFTVLANAAVTCTNGTITGDVGTFLATGSITTTSCPITGGTKHVGDAAAKAAYKVFTDEYTALTPKLGECTTANTLTGTLAGQFVPSGVYCVAGLPAKAGLLTLTGSGPWTFKVLGYLEGNSFSVVTADATKACNVTWWVRTYSAMTTSNSIGTILAGTYITLTGGTFHGNAWAGASGGGDVTITGTAVTGCAVSGGNGNGGGNGDGDKCDKGDKGDKGDKCDNGDKGDKCSNDEHGGTPGHPAVQGCKDDKGDKGNKDDKGGDKGDNGDKGDKGKP